MSTSPFPPQAANSVNAADDEIDLGQLAAALGRRWRLIAGVTVGALAVTSVNTLVTKPVWEGEFQIVLSNKDDGAGGMGAQLLAANPMLANLAGLQGGSNDMETELTILQSPLVMRPVFDAVRARKQAAGDEVSKLPYEAWAKGSLKVKLEKGTSILNVAYRDSDKKIILPALNLISKTYQFYSGRDRRQSIENTIQYLNERLANIGPKAEASMRSAQGFALANGLGLAGTASTAGPDSAGSGAGSVDAARTMAESKVIELKQQLANARRAGNEVLFQAPQLAPNGSLYSQYQNLESQLAEKRSRLQDNDPIIANLQRQKQSLITTLNQETINLLEGQLATAQAQLQAASRPRDVVLLHRSLLRKALRDERILTDLENQLQLTRLEQARQVRPWELISNPTLKEQPVSPNVNRNLALGLLGGLVLGSGAALVAERRTGRVFALDELKAALPGELLAEIPEQDDPESRSTLLQLLASGPLAAMAPGSLALIPVGLEPGSLAELAQALEAACGRPVLCSTDLVACRACVSQLLVTRSGAATREQLSELRQQLRLQGAPVAGWLLLRSTTPEA